VQGLTLFQNKTDVWGTKAARQSFNLCELPLGPSAVAERQILPEAKRPRRAQIGLPHFRRTAAARADAGRFRRIVRFVLFLSRQSETT